MAKTPYGALDVAAYVQALPPTSAEPIQERQVVLNNGNGVRVFRIYKPVQLHLHQLSDTYLYVLSGRATATIDTMKQVPVQAGQLLYWSKRVTHGITRVLEEPLVFLVFDTPARQPNDMQPVKQ